MLIYLVLAVIAWFIIGKLVSLKSSVWLLIAALFLTVILAAGSFVILLVLDPMAQGRTAGMAFWVVLMAGIWSAIRSYKKTGQRQQTEQRIEEQRYGLNQYDTAEMKSRRSQLKK